MNGQTSIEPSLRRAFALAYEALTEPTPGRVELAHAFAGETIARLSTAVARPSREWDETSELIELLRLVLRWVAHKAQHLAEPAVQPRTAVRS